MSDIVDEPRPEQGDVIPTKRPADNIDLSQFYDMFMKIEQRLPNFDHMLMAMNDYAFQRTTRQQQTNDFIGFCGVLRKGFFNWYTSSIINEMNRVPNFIDLTNQVFDDDILKKIEKKLVNSTSANTDTMESKNASINTDAGESINTNVNTDASESTNINANTNASESTVISAKIDAGESTNTNANTNASESTVISANTDAGESTNTNANTDASEITGAGVNIDDGKSASTSANANDNESTNTANTGTNSNASKSTNNCAKKTNGTFTNKRDKSSVCPNAEMMKSAKRLYRRAESRSGLLEDLPQSTETNVDVEHVFKIIMPNMTDYCVILRKRLPIDRNIHLGNDIGRHWWRQTNDRIVLNLDISDLIIEMVPEIKVQVTIFGFKVKVRRQNKWTILVANKFEKPIRKSKWVLNKHMHIKLTMTKREKEFWNKCLVTETTEVDTSKFKNHVCTNECSAPKMHKLKLSTSKQECMKNLTTFLRQEYGMDDLDTFMDEIDSIIPPTTEEKPQDSAVNLKLSVDPSTEKSLNSDFEHPPNTKQPSMDFEVPSNVAE